MVARPRIHAAWFTGLMLASVLAGCLGSDDLEQAPDPDVALEQTGLAAYLQNLSVADPSIDPVHAIIEQVQISAPDGILLDTWIVRPDTHEPVPLVLEVTPYYGGGAPVLPVVGPMVRDAVRDHVDPWNEQTGRDPVANETTFVNMLMRELVPRGYAVGISSVRGTGNSEGCFTQGGPSEAVDTATVIEVLAAASWSNGNVGLIGVSYPGTTPQDVWVEAPPSLKTIVPISGISDLYKYNFVNGVHIDAQGLAFNTYYWPMVGLSPAGLSGGTQVTDPRTVPGAIAGEACTDQIDVQEGGASSAVDGNKDTYWQLRDFHAELRASWERNDERASVFYIHGLQDWNVKPHMMEDWLPAIQETGVPYKVWLGQWGHNWPQRDDWWNSTLVAWFDEFLKDVDTGILDGPPVQVQDDTGVWRHEVDWPPSDVDLWRLYAGPDGGLSDVSKMASVSFYDYAGGTTDGIDNRGPGFVLWESPPVAEDVQVSGLPRFVANVTASGDRANLVLTLAETDGETVRAINFGVQSLNHVADLSAGAEDISGITQQVDLRFFPQADVIQAGNRTVLIASYDTQGRPGPGLIPVATGSTITIEDAYLELPVDRTIVVETPQPCWDTENEAAPCYLIR